MLTYPTLDKLQQLKLFGMAKALKDQFAAPDMASLSFEDRLGMLIDHEATDRENRRLAKLLGEAKLKQQACVEDIDYRHPRGLDKSLLAALTSCQWVKDHFSVIITGPTGVGKSYLACALAQKACREGFHTLYIRVSRLFNDLALAKGDGRYTKLLAALAKKDVLLLDDWGLAPLTEEQRRDFLEIVEDRNGTRATIITSQLPLDHWHDHIGDPTIADAILDRLVNRAHAIHLTGDSMRKKKRPAQAT